jgi:hypothetical protein
MRGRGGIGAFGFLPCRFGPNGASYSKCTDDAEVPYGVEEHVPPTVATFRPIRLALRRRLLYRHTTPEMAARIATAIEQRLRLVLEVAEQALDGQRNRLTQRVF